MLRHEDSITLAFRKSLTRIDGVAVLCITFVIVGVGLYSSSAYNHGPFWYAVFRAICTICVYLLMALQNVPETITAFVLVAANAFILYAILSA